MQPSKFLRISLYAMVCLASWGLWLGDEFSFPYPAVVVLAAVIAFLFTDLRNSFVVPNWLSPLLGLGIFAIAVLEEFEVYQVDPVRPLGHLLVMLQLAFFFHAKKSGTYWGMIFMSFLQILIACLHSNKPGFGVLLITYIILGFWVLSQFAMLRDFTRWKLTNNFSPWGEWASNSVKGCVREDGSRGLDPKPVSEVVFSTPRASFAASAFTGIAILCVSFMIFLVAPRSERTTWTSSYFSDVKVVSGFEESIKLGQLGTILESDDEVMTISLYDEFGEPFRPDVDPYWRGVPLTHYLNGKWQRQGDVYQVRSPWANYADVPHIRQEIKLEPFQRDVLFGMRPMLYGKTKSGVDLEMARSDGTIIRPAGMGSGPLEYTVISPKDQDMQQTNELPPRLIGHLMTQISPELKNELREFMIQVGIVDADKAASKDLLSDEIARRSVAYLRFSGEFEYSLTETVEDPTIDPVIDFLKNRKVGHCEYYASSLALMLRAWGIPSRVVNGFHGGEWNQVGYFFVVREKDAHSWVEAIVGPLESPRIVTLEATPVAIQENIVFEVSATERVIRQVQDTIRYLWSTYVLHYNSNEQTEGMYEPTQALVEDTRRQITQSFRSGSVLWRATMISLICLLCVPIGWYVISRLIRLFGRDYSSGKESDAYPGVFRQLRMLIGGLFVRRDPRSRTSIWFFNDLMKLLRARGIRRSPGQTPRQFAQGASQELARIEPWSTASHLPAELIRMYYHVRFGTHTLSDAESTTIRQMLDQLRGTLKRPRKNSSSGKS